MCNQHVCSGMSVASAVWQAFLKCIKMCFSKPVHIKAGYVCTKQACVRFCCCNIHSIFLLLSYWRTPLLYSCRSCHVCPGYDLVHDKVSPVQPVC